DELGPPGIGCIDGVILALTCIAAVIGQPVGRPRAFMAGDFMHQATIGPRTDRRRREQLGESTILRDVVDIDFWTAAAILPIVRAEQLASLVHLQRLPRIKHRRRLKETGSHHFFRIGDIVDWHTVASSIPGWWADTWRSASVVAANNLGL